MKPVKTAAGLRVLKDRSVHLTPRQRSAFILLDGRSTIDEILAATSSMGVTRADVDQLLQLGLVELTIDPVPAAHPTRASTLASASAFATQQAKAEESEPTAAPPRSLQQHYQDAYPIASRLTAALGLRGFRLNLAVERAGSCEELRALAPRIREAVGDKAFADLDRALNS